MKGLVLAGGSGKRLRPFSYSGPKQLFPIANRPVLFHALDQLAGADIRDVAVVVAPETAADVRAACGSGEAFGLRLSYIVQDRPGGLAHAVATARDFLGSSPFCMFLGDIVIGAELRPFAQTFAADAGASALLLLKEVDDPSAFGVAVVGPDGRIARLLEKPAVPPSRLALAGVYFFRAELHAAIERIRPSPRGELEITDAIAELLAQGLDIRFEELSAFWLDIGKRDDLLRANDAALDAWATRDIRGAVDAASVIEGRVRIAASATITRSTITGPVVIDEGVVLEDARIGPFCSLGPRVTVVRSRLDRCVLLADSRVEDIPRLFDTVLGRRASVQNVPGQHDGLRLWLGDDCCAEVSRPGH